MTQALAPRNRPCSHDSSDAIAWITHVLEQRPEAAPIDFAVTAGVAPKTIKSLLGPCPQSKLRTRTFAKIMNVGPDEIRVDPRRVVPGHPARRIVAELVEQGWSLGEIAGAAGLGVLTLDGRNMDMVHASTVARLVHARGVLSERFRRGERGKHGRFAYVPSFPMLRQVDALMVLGWSLDEIGRRAGVSRTALRTSNERVQASTAQAVRNTYEQLRFRHGPSDLTRLRAKQLGYAPWGAWPDGAMEDERGVPQWMGVEDRVWRSAIRERYGRNVRRNN